MATPRNLLRFNNKLYDLDVGDLARIAARSRRWVYVHRDRLGGVKRPWDSTKREAIRFPSVGLTKALKDLGLKPQSEIAPWRDEPAVAAAA